MTYIPTVSIIESAVFSRQVRLALPEDEYRLLQLALSARPTIGALIPGSGGLRKLRWRLTGRGKRGGARVIYYWHGARGTVHLLFLYAKNDRSDLSREELRALRQEIDHL
ncbi:type II toxin-antitoxin system RelE/ParE family toxin [Pseudogemmatithrix spongiicola]|uniref:Type II toxin-antitoxin system RelE/ParE family toxin n=1 Tax=Pseudogemmatithrix spongiicola TaxID=3062599 RepID=A0AA49JV45_9BACT|nr:type II toxin-antitoxin system RelE/ParE family toxin [Gemmatimonadaceae bacterium 'strain 138']WKW15377.1 type II toxin-antitoxin system RelE/ParE family toxin [Gemmatimonadaceae bacterium 'strain 318']